MSSGDRCLGWEEQHKPVSDGYPRGGEGTGKPAEGGPSWKGGMRRQAGPWLSLHLVTGNKLVTHANLAQASCFFQMPKTQISWAGIRSHISSLSMNHLNLNCRYSKLSTPG